MESKIDATCNRKQLMFKRLKYIPGGFALLLLISFIIISVYYFHLKVSIPDYSDDFGEAPIRGDNIKIHRNERGFPFIYAENNHDAYFSLGFLHAQERLFQMDVMRRAASGTLSEVYGGKLLQVDKMARVIGLKRTADEAFKSSPPEIKKMLEAYSEGVNYYMEQSEFYSIEFDVLGYVPENWKPEDSFLTSKIISWLLNLSWWNDLAYLSIAERVGTEKAANLIISDDGNTKFKFPEIKKEQRKSFGFLDADRQLRELLGFESTSIGSNNWVVSGSRSVSGKPIIANDPHISLSLPGIWYYASLRSDSLNCDGFTVPGVPVFVIGKNQHISWVYTNLMTDDCDFYAEQIDSTGDNYFFDGRYIPLKTIHEEIKVKDSVSVFFDVHLTHRGPVISGVHPFNNNIGSNPSVLSMKWAGYDFNDEILSVKLINQSKNWDDFKNAASYFSTPGQNLIYADDTGNIGYICAAKIPIRNSASPPGIFDGRTGDYDWKGYIPLEKLPLVFNPEAGFLASANNKPEGSYDFYISNSWEPDSRIDRIKQLLSSKDKHSIKDFREYQSDIISPYANSILPYILAAFDSVRIRHNNLETALELLSHWDSRMHSRSQAPAIFNTFKYFFIKNLFSDDLDEELLNEYLMISSNSNRVVSAFLKGNDTLWFDDKRTDEIEGKNEIIRRSMAEAISWLENELGKELAEWQWGKIHKVTLKHLFHGQLSILDHFIDSGPYEAGGDGTTIFNTDFSFTNPFDVRVGQTLRFLYDFGNPNELQVVLPGGQSGHLLKDSYKDQTELWLKGRNIVLDISGSDTQKYFPLLTLISRRQDEK